MHVMLLAAGRSTRLGPLGEALPKPLVPVCGYPVIRFGLEACRSAGVRNIVVNLHHHAERLRQALAERPPDGLSIRFSFERDLLGTGGGLAHARALLGDGSVLVMNAKVAADLDLAELETTHRSSGAEATLLVRDDPDVRSWGAISVDAGGRVVGILDARSPAPPVGAVVERMFTGIHMVEPRLLDRLPPAGPSDVIRHAYIPALLAGAHLAAAQLGGYFAEHSTPVRYLDGNLALLDRPALLRWPPGPLVGVDAEASVGPRTTVIAPCRLAPGAVVETDAVVGPGVVVCTGAHVSAGARLTRTVVWPDATAAGMLEDAVVTPGGVVAAGHG